MTSKLNIWNFSKKYGVLKTPVFGSKTGVSEFTEYLEFVLFRIFQKLQKLHQA